MTRVPADLVGGSLDDPDEVVTFDNGRVERVTVDGVTVSRATMQPGWRWSEDEADMVGEPYCPKDHVVYVESGRLGVEMEDGTREEFGAGEVAVIPPGHDGWTVGDDPVVYVDVSDER